MNKEDFINEYNRLGETTVDNLYIYGCLKTSGFNEEQSYNLINLLYQLWLKDESNSSISTISDCLYENYEELDIENMTIREILVEIL